MTLARGVARVLVAALGWQAPVPRPHATAPGPGSCEPCHQSISAAFARTAHYRTSAEPTARAIKGRFSEGHNTLHTSSPGVSFRMEQRNGVFYEVGIDSARGTATTGRIDIVVGSGRRGQTYLSWRGGLLYELPVSYLVGIELWINSPGYADGQIDFRRPVVPRCLECHTTSFRLEAERGAVRYGRGYVLGISCEKCHGDGTAHVKHHAAHPGDSLGRFILNPAGFAKDRQIDMCALCHSGERDPVRPSFSYRPGDKLDDYFVPQSERDSPVPDVHGNQVGLLQRSRCFRSSPGMSCSTCHDVHHPQRDLTGFAEKCLACHETRRHPMADRIGGRMLTSCIECHMPTRKSDVIQINTPTRQFGLYFRSHAIGIYPAAAAKVLGTDPVERQR